MGARGAVSRPDAAAGADHVCWVYDDEESFAEVARGYLAEGLARGERLLCIDGTIAKAVRGAGPAFPDVEELIAGGALEILDASSAYERADEVRTGQQLEFYESQTRRALAEGYTGLRVVADVTDLAGDVARRADLLEWERLSDDFIGHGSGMRALCAYAGRRLDGAAVTDVATMHPAVHACVEPPFRIWSDDDTLTLAGEVDSLSAPRLGLVLGVSPVRPPLVVLDLARVDFMDVSGLRAIARWAVGLREHDTRVVLLGTSRLFRRMWTTLGFGDLTAAIIGQSHEG